MPDQIPPVNRYRRTDSALCATRTYRSINSRLAGGVSLGPEHPIITVNIALPSPLALVCYRASTEWSGLFCLCRNHRRAVWHTCCGGIDISQTLNGSNEVPLWDRLFAPLWRQQLVHLLPDYFSILIFHSHCALRTDGNDRYSQRCNCRAIAIAAGMVAVWCLPRLHAICIK